MMPSSLQNRTVPSENGTPEPLAPVLVANQPAGGFPIKESEPRSSNKAKKEESDSPFAVSVTDVYEGPLDLLLDLIRKQDIDIYDIPIARITAQYLAYVEKIKELDVNVAADFIYGRGADPHKVQDVVASGCQCSSGGAGRPAHGVGEPA